MTVATGLAATLVDRHQSRDRAGAPELPKVIAELARRHGRDVVTSALEQATSEGRRCTWPRELEGLRILHLSDVHLGYFVSLDDLERTMLDAEAHRPDLVLVTGDLSDDLKVLPDALRIIDEAHMRPDELRGGWAGEIGQTQFLPTPYVKYAVDFDGDGKKDLIHSVPDILASTANFLKGHGWQAGQSWEPGSANYDVIRDWNRAQVYQRTISVMASKLSRR